MAKRSPILGYNHNVRHRGLLFHVQTEDSGVDNPHIFTHLFHSGVIISTRKLQYDRGSAEEVVKALMQAQHKASLRELKAGTFDEKISSYLGEHPDLEPSARARTQRDTLDSPPPEHEPRAAGRSYGMGPTSAPPGPLPGPPSPPPLSRLSEHGAMAEPSRTGRSGDVSNAFRMIKREGTAPEELTPPPLDLRPPSVAPPMPRKRASSQTGYAHHRTGQLERMPDPHEPLPSPAPRAKGRAPAVVSPVAARTPGPSPLPMGRTTTPGVAPVRPAGKQRPPSSPSIPTPTGQAPRAGVVVSRPAVIVGGAPRVISPRDAGAGPVVPRTVRRAREDSRQSLFGKDLISERSLDEVILAYLSEDSQDK